MQRGEQSPILHNLSRLMTMDINNGSQTVDSTKKQKQPENFINRPNCETKILQERSRDSIDRS